MKFLIELVKTAAWFIGFLGSCWFFYKEQYVSFALIFITSGILIYYCAAWLSHLDYVERLSEYGQYKMPVFIIQDPERQLQVSSQAEMVREALQLSGNKLLNPETDVHEIYFQDPREKAAVETPIEYQARVEAFKKKVTEEFMNRQLKTVDNFDYFKSIYFNQDLTPPEPMQKRFKVFDWS